MDDYKEKVDDVKDKIMNKAASIDQKGKFFTFSKPFINMLDGSSFFTKYSSYLYILLALLCLWQPLNMGYHAIFEPDASPTSIFDAKFMVILTWLVAFAAVAISWWISFQIIFSRKDQLKNSDQEYPAHSIVSNLVRTVGECYGVYIAISGTIISILALVLTTNDSEMLSWYWMQMGLEKDTSVPIIQLLMEGYPAIIPDAEEASSFAKGFGGLESPMDTFGIKLGNWQSIIKFPIAGFVYMLFFRLLSEMINVFPTIAKNTKK